MPESQRAPLASASMLRMLALFRHAQQGATHHKKFVPKTWHIGELSPSKKSKGKMKKKPAAKGAPKVEKKIEKAG